MRTYCNYLFLFLFLLNTQAFALDSAEEYEIKAVYLLNLGDFIKWTEDALQGGFVICLLGKDPFGANLDFVTKKEKKVQKQRVSVKQLSVITEINNCHILFVSNSEQDRLATIFEAVKNKPILTVGDSERFVVQGGMIQFYHHNGKIRMLLDPKTIEESGLKASSQLMRIAQRIEK
jgi:hypothetical protein